MNVTSNNNWYTPLLVFAKTVFTFYGFWIILFQISRLIFFGYHADKVGALGSTSITTAIWAGLPMDISATSYIFILPLLILLIHLWLPIKSFAKSFFKWYGLLMIGLVSLITFADAEVYSILGYKINAEVVTYLAHPKEAMASSESSPLLGLILGVITFIYIASFTYKKWILPKIKIQEAHFGIQSAIRNIILTIASIGGIIIALRGGTGLAPMGAGHAYHAPHQILNHGATNASWNFLYSIQKRSSDSPCQFSFMADEIAQSISEKIFISDNTQDTISILSQPIPNVVFIVLEGWPIDVTASFGGESGNTPFFDSLAQDGLRFTNIYASGDRTFKGVPAVLSGYPAFPSGSIIQYINKMETLPCIASSMKTKGYATSFIYGGDIEFKSISSFINHCGYDQILSQNDFSSELAEGSKWGVHDHHVFERAAREINTLKEPFLSTILTQSSHEPYTVPIPTKIVGDDVSNLFRNSVYYADWSIRQFFNQIINEPWYDNTLFVFTSDHGKPLPIQREAWEHETFQIPALIYGSPLKSTYRNQDINLIGSQIDIVKTLLDQFNINTDAYTWSRNLLNPSTSPFAFYSFEAGVGTVTDNGVMVYDRVSGNPINQVMDELSEAEQLIELKAVLQRMCVGFEEL